jgi:prepilin-type N-terminal cleavage/methylation domain-containing protein
MLLTPAVRAGFRRRHARGGFSFLEVLVVIAIIATLAAIALGIAQGIRQYAATARARADLAVLALTLEQYRSHYGDYPQTADSPEKFCRALAGRLGPTGATIRGRNFLSTVPVSLRDPEHPDADTNAIVDPWGHAYQYVFFTRQIGTAPVQHGYVLFCFGPRHSTEILPSRAEVVPNTSGEQGGVVSSARVNAKNIYAGQ